MSASVSGISDTMSLMAAWVAAESEAKSGVEGTGPAGRGHGIDTAIIDTVDTHISSSSEPLSRSRPPSMQPANILTPDRPWPD